MALKGEIFHVNVKNNFPIQRQCSLITLDSTFTIPPRPPHKFAYFRASAPQKLNDERKAKKGRRVMRSFLVKNGGEWGWKSHIWIDG
jgi:hypothetical protein